jgi:hypothetical protein
LIVEVLAGTFGDGDSAAFEFEYAEGDAVDVQHDVWALGVFFFNGDFFGNGKVVFLGVFQLISQTVWVFSPASSLTFTP